MMLKIAPLLETTDGMSKLSKLGAAVFRKPALLSNQRFHLCRAESSIVLGPLQQLGVGFKPLQVLFLRSEADPQGHSILLKKGGLKCRGLQLHTCRGHRESTTCQLQRILNVSPGVCPRFCQCTYSKHTPQPGFVSLTFPKNVSSGRSLLGRSTIFDTSHQASHNCFYTQTGGHEQKQPRRGVSTTSGALQAAGVIGQLITQESLEVANEGELEEPVQSSVGGIHLIVGPMFAGKTTALLNRMQAELIAGRRVALVKSDKDTRYGLNAVISHDGMQMPCWPVPNLSTFRAKIGEEMYGKLDVIGIDEAQFFKDLYNFCQVAADCEGKTLIVAGLDGDFMRNNFGSALDLIPLADSVVKLSSRCELCGKSAAFTLRKTDDKKTEVIGGADVYMPVCRQHYVNGQNLKREWPSISTASRTRSCSEFDQRCRL